ncbi:MAG: hypothetical protein ABUS49_00445 [Acidobacteriota bacterium]
MKDFRKNRAAAAAILSGLSLVLLLAGCQKSDTKILIGATTLPGAGAPPIAGSVIVVTGKTIRAVGLQKDIPIPQDSERTDLTGAWVVPKGQGRIAPGEPANLTVLRREPRGSDPAGPDEISRELIEGEWKPAP